MKTKQGLHVEFEKLAGDANEMIVQAYDLTTRALDHWARHEFADFVRLMRQAVANHGKVAVIYDSMANECERLTLS